MATTKSRKKQIMGVIAAMLAFALLAVALNASWVEDILNPIPPEELAEIEKAFDKAQKVLHAEITVAITLTPEEQEALLPYSSKISEGKKFTHLFLVSIIDGYKSFPSREYLSPERKPRTLFVLANEVCKSDFTEGEYIFYLSNARHTEAFPIPYSILSDRLRTKVESFFDGFSYFENIDISEIGFHQSYIDACSRSGHVADRHYDVRYGKEKSKNYHPGITHPGLP